MKTCEFSQFNRQQIEVLLAQQVEQIDSQAEQLSCQSERIATLQHQLDWFKRQLFGRKSEKQIIDNPAQSSLLGDSLTEAKPEESATEVKGHRRKSNTQRTGDEVNDSGLRFDDTVPQKIIELSLPEMTKEEAAQIEVIDYKETYRLAQQHSSTAAGQLYNTGLPPPCYPS